MSADGFDASTYGDAFADVYDDWYQNISDVEGTVETVARLADGRPVLELGVGTGRIAVPLAENGVSVTGIDSSQKMLDRLEAASSRIVNPVLGDMATLVGLPDSHFGVIFAAWNTFFNLTTPGAQLQCLKRCAEVAAPGGFVAIEVFVPSEDPAAAEGQMSVTEVTADAVHLAATWRDPETQTVTGQNVRITEAGNELRPWKIRYCSPIELDEMATTAGLTLVSRTAGWRNEPFGPESNRHVSIYQTNTIQA